MIEETVHIQAPPALCMSVIADFPRYPEWQDWFRKVEVLETDEQGRGLCVRYEIDLKLARFAYVLAYEYKQRPLSMAWHLVEGDVRDIQGAWVFRKAGKAGTEATFSLQVEPGRFVPGAIARKLTQGMLRSSIDQLKVRAEGMA